MGEYLYLCVVFASADCQPKILSSVVCQLGILGSHVCTYVICSVLVVLLESFLWVCLCQLMGVLGVCDL